MLHMVSTHIIPTRNEAKSLCARLTSVECPPIRTTHCNPFVDIHSFAAHQSNSPIILPAISACDVSHGHFTLLHTLVATTPDSTNTAGINAFLTISPPFPRKFPHATARLTLLHSDFPKPIHSLAWSKILQLKQLPHLDLRVLSLPCRVRESFTPLQRLFP